MTESIDHILEEINNTLRVIEAFHQSPFSLRLVREMQALCGIDSHSDGDLMQEACKLEFTLKRNADLLQTARDIFHNSEGMENTNQLIDFDKEIKKRYPYMYKDDLRYKIRELNERKCSGVKYPKTPNEVAVGSIIWLMYGISSSSSYDPFYYHVPIKCKVIDMSKKGYLTVQFYNIIHGLNKLEEQTIKECYKYDCEREMYFSLDYELKQVE